MNRPAIIFFALVALAVFLPAQATADNPPQAAIISPASGSNFSSSDVEFACRGWDDQKLGSLTVFHNGTTWHAAASNYTPVNDSITFFTITMPDGYFVWNCRAVDNYTGVGLDVSNYTILVDASAPNYSGGQSNSTANGTAVLFSVFWNDSASGLSSYIFSFDNGVGSFTNDSTVTFSGNEAWSNVTKMVNSSSTATVRWMVYAFDNMGHLGVSEIYSFITAYPSTTNRPPYVVSPPRITPDPADNSTALTCTVKFADATSAYLNYLFTWYRNGIQNASLDSYSNSIINNSFATPLTGVPAALLSAGSAWVCRARAYDGSLYSEWVSSQTVTILGNSSQNVNRIVLSCPEMLVNKTSKIIVVNYKISTITCSDIALSAQYSNGTLVPPATIFGSQYCSASRKAEYEIRPPSSDVYTITATSGYASAACTVNFRRFSNQTNRVPEMHWGVILASALAALLLINKKRGRPVVPINNGISQKSVQK